MKDTWRTFLLTLIKDPWCLKKITFLGLGAAGNKQHFLDFCVWKGDLTFCWDQIKQIFPDWLIQESSAQLFKWTEQLSNLPLPHSSNHSYITDVQRLESLLRSVRCELIELSLSGAQCLILQGAAWGALYLFFILSNQLSHADVMYLLKN